MDHNGTDSKLRLLLSSLKGAGDALHIIEWIYKFGGETEIYGTRYLPFDRLVDFRESKVEYHEYAVGSVIHDLMALGRVGAVRMNADWVCISSDFMDAVELYMECREAPRSVVWEELTQRAGVAKRG